MPQTRLTQSQQNRINNVQSRPFVDCFNRNPCCELWAKEDECKRNADYMRQYCRASCTVCNPAYNVSNGKCKYTTERASFLFIYLNTYGYSKILKLQNALIDIYPASCGLLMVTVKEIQICSCKRIADNLVAFVM